MKSISEVKIDSKRKLNAYWHIPVFVTAIVILTSALISYFPGTIGQIISFLFTSVSSVFTSMLFLNIAKNDDFKQVNFSWLYVSPEKLLKCLIYSALMYIATFLITYLSAVVSVFLVPFVTLFILVIEIYFSFSMIIILDTNASILDAVQTSMELIRGHFFKIIVLGVSFIGWLIVGCLTLGIGLLWVFPYFSISLSNYYLELKRVKNLKTFY